MSIFVSRKEAEARLSGDRNLFRDRSVEKDAEELEGEDAALEKEAPLDDDDTDSISLQHLDNLIHPKRPGKSSYQGKIESQAAIAETAIILGERQAGNIFDLSRSQAEAYHKGLSSTNQITAGIPPKPELKRRINIIKEALAEKAADRLDKTLNLLTPTKLSEIKRATNIARVAKDMAVIMEKCSDKKEETPNTVHFHLYTPPQASINQYETVDVGGSLPVIDASPK